MFNNKNNQSIKQSNKKAALALSCITLHTTKSSSSTLNLTDPILLRSLCLRTIDFKLYITSIEIVKKDCLDEEHS